MVLHTGYFVFPRVTIVVKINETNQDMKCCTLLKEPVKGAL